MGCGPRLNSTRREQPAALMSASLSRKPRLLLVDDERDILVTLEAVLELAGYEVRAVASRRAALSALTGPGLDIVVTDLNLGAGEDGLVILRRVRRGQPGLPVIVLTGHGSEDLRRRVEREGAFAYLTKPCDVRQLRAVLAQAAAGTTRSS